MYNANANFFSQYYKSKELTQNFKNICQAPFFILQTSQVSFTFSEVFKTGVVTEVKQMALTGVRTIRTLKAEDGVTVKPMEIQTFKLTVCP